ncbi:uncharacterized protein LOC125782246 [Astyanax mexicanus]|uniref:uncharacterized protein LOC125782246 n=1 Tax=Astyanax mexicanus TaxID=7994 RepID=UPI0020CB693F|nr:uncharacterized protein LOC125782246 [Astyanax mexicanus]
MAGTSQCQRGTLGTDPVEDELGTQLLEETDLVRSFAPEQPPRQPSRSFAPEQPPRQPSRSFAPEQPPRQPSRSFAPEQPPRQPSRSFAPEQPPRQPSRSFAPEQPPRQPSRSFAPEQPPRQPSRSFAPEQPPRQPSRSFAPEQPPRQPPRSFAPELPRPPSGPSEPEHWQSLPKSQVDGQQQTGSPRVPVSWWLQAQRHHSQGMVPNSAEQTVTFGTAETGQRIEPVRPVAQQPPREQRPTRERRPPKHFKDYVCNAVFFSGMGTCLCRKEEVV